MEQDEGEGADRSRRDMWAKMTLREKQLVMLADLLEEKASEVSTVWLMRLDEKIAELRAAMETGNENM